MEFIIPIITAVVALVAGVIAGKFIFAKNTNQKIEEAELHAKNILKEAELRAETTKREKELEAKERFVSLKAAHEKEVNERNRKLMDAENRNKKKEQSLNQKEEK